MSSSRSVKKRKKTPSTTTTTTNKKKEKNHRGRSLRDALWEAESPYYEEIAMRLLFGTTIRAGEGEYHIREIEFYSHEDPYTHLGDEQLSTCGGWYFHRTKPGGRWKGGPFVGLDISFAPVGTAGGILIRGLSRVVVDDDQDQYQYIDGPCNCVRELLRSCDVSTISELFEMDSFGHEDAFGENNLLRLVEHDEPFQFPSSTSSTQGGKSKSKSKATPMTMEWKSTSRVGLSLPSKKKSEQKMRSQYHLAPLRYLRAPYETKNQNMNIIKSKTGGVLSIDEFHAFSSSQSSTSGGKNNNNKTASNKNEDDEDDDDEPEPKKVKASAAAKATATKTSKGKNNKKQEDDEDEIKPKAKKMRKSDGQNNNDNNRKKASATVAASAANAGGDKPLRLILEEAKRPHYEELAMRLLFCTTLRAGTCHYRLREIEFYSHEDPYTHMGDEQVSTCGGWYFHRTKPGGGWKGGTFMGLDISFAPVGTAGGILIRGLSRVDDADDDDDNYQTKYFDGSCNCVRELLRACGASKIKDLVEMESFHYDALTKDHNGGIMRLIEHEPRGIVSSSSSMEWKSTSRVGLSEPSKKPEQEKQREQYHLAPLRYLQFPYETKKEKKNILNSQTGGVYNIPSPVKKKTHAGSGSSSKGLFGESSDDSDDDDDTASLLAMAKKKGATTAASKTTVKDLFGDDSDDDDLFGNSSDDDDDVNKATTTSMSGKKHKASQQPSYAGSGSAMKDLFGSSSDDSDDDKAALPGMASKTNKKGAATTAITKTTVRDFFFDSSDDDDNGFLKEGAMTAMTTEKKEQEDDEDEKMDAARYRRRSVMETQRHNMAMEKIEREKTLWQSKTSELEYRMRLYKEYNKLKSGGVSDSDVERICPDMQMLFAGKTPANDHKE